MQATVHATHKHRGPSRATSCQAGQALCYITDPCDTQMKLLRVSFATSTGCGITLAKHSERSVGKVL